MSESITTRQRALNSLIQLRAFSHLERVANKLKYIDQAVAENVTDAQLINVLNEAWHMTQIEVMHHLVTCAQIPVRAMD